MALRLLLLVVLFSGLPFPGLALSSSVKDAVVKIYTVYNSYSYHNPWQTMGQSSFHGSGSIIAGHRILTNAHVVSDQIFIQVRRSGQAKRYTARVEAVAHESDLAILKVDDDKFFQGVSPLSLGGLAHVRDKVGVYGFPDGGDKLSITEGIVSRVEHVEYAHSNAYLLACQIDAPVNSGNSGGPVLKDGKLVGVAFQGMSGATVDNIGYMVPVPIIQHFLQDIGDGHYDGIPSLGLSMQELENPAMRHYYQMQDEQSGVLVNKVYPDSPAAGVLESGDVILSIDGVKVANDGTISFRPGERTYFGYLLQKKQLQDHIDLTFLRQGRTMQERITLTKSVNYERLVPNRGYDHPPVYFIFGGFVFQPLTLNYLQEFGNGGNWALLAPTELLDLFMNGEPEEGRRQVVVLTQVLADEANVGFQDFADNVIVEVNGHKISTLADLVRAIQNNKAEFHTLLDSRGFRLCLKDDIVRASQKNILKKYHIGADRFGVPSPL